MLQLNLTASAINMSNLFSNIRTWPCMEFQTVLNSLALPALDFSITSPPYMGKHHEESLYRLHHLPQSRRWRLQRSFAIFTKIYGQLADKLKPNGRAIFEVSNLKHEDGTVTTLAWDIARAVSGVLRLKVKLLCPGRTTADTATIIAIA